MFDEKRNVGVAERALTSAQMHTNYVTWGLYSLVYLVLTQLVKCETLHRGELVLLFTSIVYHRRMLPAVVNRCVLTRPSKRCKHTYIFSDHVNLFI